jgi:hypothetical protein
MRDQVKVEGGRSRFTAMVEWDGIYVSEWLPKKATALAWRGRAHHTSPREDGRERKREREEMRFC